MKKLIAFEGTDGTGKTTLSKKFAEKIKAKWTYEPNGETEELALLRRISLDSRFLISPETREMLLIDNRRIHHNSYVKPQLWLTDIVTDRCFLSGMVYAKYHNFSFRESLNKMVSSGIELFPQLIILCKNKERNIKKREHDIYDNAGEKAMSYLDSLFDASLIFLKEETGLLTETIIFNNDFNKSIDENSDNLLKLLTDGGYL
jgi:thymidylate kinase